MKRRHFLRHSMLTALSAPFILPSFGNTLTSNNYIKLTILHTNDVHSRIDPFPEDAGDNAGKGGVAHRLTVINGIRQTEENVILLDAGDIFQGTPYFNFFKGELEIKLMSSLGYDGVTMGNHDFDAGVEGFVKQLPHANFPVITTNYDFRDTELADRTIPYHIIHRGGLTIGVIGLGIELDGLVPRELYGNTVYLDPITSGDKTAKMLKRKVGVDIVICLSHLGYQYFEQKVDDFKLAQNSSYIDVILGGHTHTFLKHPTILQNQKGQPVVINQAGWGGMMLGRIDLFFSKNKSTTQMKASNMIIKQ